MHSSPGRCHCRNRLICTENSLIWSQSRSSSNAIAEKRSDPLQLLAKRPKPVTLDLFERALANDQCRLEIIAARDQDQRLAVVDVAEQIFGIVAGAADAKPQHVNGNAVLQHLEVRRPAA